MTESKHYYDFTNELSADEIYEGLLAHGLLPKNFLQCSQHKRFTTIANPNRLLSLRNRRNTFITRV